MHLQRFFAILLVASFPLVNNLAVLVESDTVTTASAVARPGQVLSYGGSLSRGCIDDNSGRGCCSNGQDFPTCYKACDDDDRCEDWCRSNCWNYWSTGPGGPGYVNNRGIGYNSPEYRGGGRGGDAYPPGHKSGWPGWLDQSPCNSGSRWVLDSDLVFFLMVLSLSALF